MAEPGASGGTRRVRHLAQANVARPRAPLDAPVMGEFVVALDAVNRIAEHSSGFVWRLRSSESHGATTLRDGSHQMMVNVSVWQSYEALHAFVYRSPHGAYVRGRARWFEPIRQAFTLRRRFEPDGRPSRRPGGNASADVARAQSATGQYWKPVWWVLLVNARQGSAEWCAVSRVERDRFDRPAVVAS